jgi:hypothetical protein
MQSRNEQIKALQKRIAKLRPTTETEEALCHLDNAKQWNSTSEYSWTEAIAEAKAILRSVR